MKSMLIFFFPLENISIYLGAKRVCQLALALGKKKWLRVHTRDEKVKIIVRTATLRTSAHCLQMQQKLLKILQCVESAFFCKSEKLKKRQMT